MNIAINGFGRIGRTFLRTVLLDEKALTKIKVVAINIGPAKIEHVAHLFKYDSLMGIFPGLVSFEDGDLLLDDTRIKIIAETDPAKLPWGKMSIDWVVDCSGKFTKREAAQLHLDAGAKAVLISAPATDEDASIVMGVNEDVFQKNNHKIVSLGSCTTNALVTMIKVMHDAFTIERAFVTTVHAYTSSQLLLDNEDKDLRRARAAAMNIIPTTTGAQKVVGKVIPELAGLVQAHALRVPVPKGSIIDLAFQSKKPITVQSINAAFLAAATGPMRGVLDITMDPYVSSDICGDSRSSVVDGQLTNICGPNFGKVFGWYDNEWGYSCRLRDFLVKLG